jgi:hypothetical protein
VKIVKKIYSISLLALLLLSVLVTAGGFVDFLLGNDDIPLTDEQVADSVFMELKVNDAIAKESIFTLSNPEELALPESNLKLSFNEVCGHVKSYYLYELYDCIIQVPLYKDEVTCDGKTPCTIKQIITGYAEKEDVCEKKIDYIDGVKDYKIKADIENGDCEQTLPDGNKIITKGYMVDWIPELTTTKETIKMSSWAWYNATGGTMSYDGLYTIINFTTNGTLKVEGTSINVTYLIIGGGGSGGSSVGGGGGAGGFLTGDTILAVNNYTIIIGSGGENVISENNGKNGTLSSFNGNTSYGGGGGAGIGKVGLNGGSGGGGAGDGSGGTWVGGRNVLGQGYDGGKGVGSGTDFGAGGGGGGAKSSGGNTTATNGGNGGSGETSTITGINTTFSCGGGGGSYTDESGIGGCLQAGNGTKGNTMGGANATGYGMGGGGGSIGAGSGGRGYQGIVIIRYLTGDFPAGDSTSPNTTLISPSNNTITGNHTQGFTFNATDETSNTLNCSLLINTTKYGSINVTNKTQTTITPSSNITGGNYIWKINCSDGINYNLSETRDIVFCTENWTINYGLCNSSSLRMIYYLDNNNCNNTYGLPADNGTYEACVYCAENWTTNYGSCNTSDEMLLSYVDVASCNTTFDLPADNGTSGTCNYCSQSLSYTDGACTNNYAIRTYSDTNYLACCLVTGLVSDCGWLYSPYNVTSNIYCGPPACTGSLYYPYFMDVDQIEIINYTHSCLDNSSWLAIYFEGSFYNLTASSTQRFYVAVTSNESEDIPFDIYLRNSTSDTLLSSGTMRWRNPYYLTIHFWKSDSNETNQWGSTKSALYKNEFQYVYMQYASETSGNPLTDISYLDSMVSWLPFYTDTFDSHIDNTLSFWSDYVDGEAVIKLYEPGNYTIGIVTIPISGITWNEEFVYPQFASKKYKSQIISSDAPVALEGTDAEIEVYISMWEVNKFNVIMNVIYNIAIVLIGIVIFVFVAKFGGIGTAFLATAGFIIIMKLLGLVIL